jgi:hypothetical protein
MRWIPAVALGIALGSCGGKAGRTTTTAAQAPIAETTSDWMVAVLPPGAQIIVEIDLARLRANAVVGEVAARMLAELGAEQKLPGLPMAVQGSPLGEADAVVLGAYGVGTAQAATIVVIATAADLAGGTRIAANLSVLGPEEWTSQVVARAAIAALAPDLPAPLGAKLPIMLADELARLREHAMPAKAPGAVLRITARLSFDARVALARQTGLEAAPAQLSLWADVVDDFAVILDADAADPGEKDSKAARKQVAASLHGLFNAIAGEPSVRALGLANNIAGARFVEQGTWIRAIIEVGPRQLARAVERARAMLPPAS